MRTLTAARGAAPIDPALLRRQQREMRGHGRLHWLHWAIVGGSVLVTGIAWQFSRSLLEERASRQFERAASDVVSLVRERLAHYEDALLSGVAAIDSHGGEMTRDGWRRYARRLDLAERYPGISGIGVIHHVEEADLEAFVARVRLDSPGFAIHPEHDRGIHLPITYIEPEAQNAAAVGLDVAFETHRREAALRAMTTRTTQVSGPIVLVQDSGRTPGFLFYAPYFRDAERGPDNASPEAPPGTRQRFGGFVYAPLVVKSLIDGVLERDNRDVTLTIRDGDTTLYADPGEGGTGAARFASAIEVPVHGRTWTFELRAAPGFEVGSGQRNPLVVLACGLAIDAMLLGLFLLMARSNRRVLRLAERVTNGLSAQAESLAEANDKLASFAHVVSHDLKTPLRGVQDLVGFLREDLEDHLDAPETNPEVRRSIDGIDRQARRGSALIDGILQYSLADVDEETQAFVDSRSLVEDIVEAVGLPRDRVELDGDFPAFRTYAVRFRQVLENLVGNAAKYHDDPANARIRIRASIGADYHRFFVEDDGPGIEPRFHERIFEAFQTLGTRTDIDSSGIGLSIVKKSVESLGGAITLSSRPGEGATFGFDWPATILAPPAAEG